MLCQHRGARRGGERGEGRAERPPAGGEAERPAGEGGAERPAGQGAERPPARREGGAREREGGGRSVESMEF